MLGICHAVLRPRGLYWLYALDAASACGMTATDSLAYNNEFTFLCYRNNVIPFFY